MLKGATSLASPSDKDSMAPLLAEYRADVACGSFAATLLRFTMVPVRRARMPGKAAWRTKRGPKKLVWNWRVASFSLLGRC